MKSLLHHFLFWTILFQLPALAAWSQTATIRGKVSLAANMEAAPGADVFVQSTSINAITNSQGKYELKNLTPGKYAIAVFYLGYKSQVKEVTLEAGQIAEVDFSLELIEAILEELTISDLGQKSSTISRLRSVEGTAIYEAKKSEVIMMDLITANLATNNSRQIYSKVPGLNIWESDAGGIQLGIGGRGLSPNRTSNFNTRQNGYDISADPLGYPESYYTPPAEAIEQIQIVRGAASLQYGTQFGGMVNFVMKKGPKNTPLELTTRQTVGSFGLFNSFNSIGGTVGKLNYYTAYQRKQGNGWRPNSAFESNFLFTDWNFQLTDKFFICFEYTHMDYLAQQAGGLTDKQFRENPRQSLRDRNWFRINWNLGAVLMEYKFTDHTRLEMKNFGLLAGRDALGDLKAINRPVNEHRELIEDTFHNLGSETRLMHHYNIKGQPAVFLIGTRFFQGKTHKMQGIADKGKAANFEFFNPDSLYSDHIFPNRNFALFAENIIPVGEKFSLTPGLRYEWIDTRSDGYYQQGNYFKIDENGQAVETTRMFLDSMESKRPVFLAGLGASYKPDDNNELYANFSQNYRSITFTDIRVKNESAYVDPFLEDEKGFSADIGLRGDKKWLNYDLSVFYLNYSNKIGSVLIEKDGRSQRGRVNVADAYIIGVESFIEGDWTYLMHKKPSYNLSTFLNVALIEGRYVASEESSFEGKKVELVPALNIKTGINYRFKSFAASWQYSYMSQQFTDATNAVETSTAVDGLIPAYHVMDLSLEYTLKSFLIAGGVNNLTKNYYFTRRADGYPGPGIIPAMGRNFYLTLGYKFSKK